MTIASFFKRYAAYNVWANDRMIEWIRSGGPAVLDAETPSSFPTLRRTLLHVWDAQHIWFERLHGRSPETLPSTLDAGMANDVFDGLAASSRALDAFAAQQHEAFFASEVAYTTTKGQTLRNPAADMLLQVLQHGAYHRGQLVTMGRALGLPTPPQTDFIAFVRQHP